MLILGAAFAVFAFAGAGVAEIGARVTRKRAVAHAVVSAVLVAASLVPIWLHMDARIRYARNSDVAEAYPQLERFRPATLTLLAFAFAVGALLSAAVAAMQISPNRVFLELSIAPLPLLAGAYYFTSLLSLTSHRIPIAGMYDNVPNVWLFIVLAAASVTLFVFHFRSAVLALRDDEPD